jgi:hypothetical protein
MCPTGDITRRIATFHDQLLKDPHHRFRSWEHCHRFFSARTSDAVLNDKDTAALHLAFYLASWGMYRGSSFLLRQTYTVHVRVIARLSSPRFSDLWQRDVGADASDVSLAPLILEAVHTVKDAYNPASVTNTLATKVLLGTMACLPACDRFFIDGFRVSGRQYSNLNRRFVERIIGFCLDHGDALREEQARIERAEGVHYPLMKLVDMYFWQIGFEAAPAKATSSGVCAS